MAKKLEALLVQVQAENKHRQNVSNYTSDTLKRSSRSRRDNQDHDPTPGHTGLSCTQDRILIFIVGIILGATLGLIYILLKNLFWTICDWVYCVYVFIIFTSISVSQHT